jgi:hypothetical protein
LQALKTVTTTIASSQTHKKAKPRVKASPLLGSDKDFDIAWLADLGSIQEKTREI